MIEIDYSPARDWTETLLAALTPGAFVIVNGISCESLRKRLYRREIYAQVSTNPGRGSVVRLKEIMAEKPKFGVGVRIIVKEEASKHTFEHGEIVRKVRNMFLIRIDNGPVVYFSANQLRAE